MNKFDQSFIIVYFEYSAHSHPECASYYIEIHYDTDNSRYYVSVNNKNYHFNCESALKKFIMKYIRKYSSVSDDYKFVGNDVDRMKMSDISLLNYFDCASPEYSKPCDFIYVRLVNSVYSETSGEYFIETIDSKKWRNKSHVSGVAPTDELMFATQEIMFEITESLTVIKDMLVENNPIISRQSFINI